MADEPEKSGQEPNLELPSLVAFGRKKKRKADRTPDEAATTEPLADPLPGSPPGDAVPPRGGLAPSAAKAKRLPPVPPPTARRPPTPPPPLAPALPPAPAPAPAPAKLAEDEVEGTETPTEALPALPIGRFTSPPSIDEPPSQQLAAPAYGDQPQVLEEPSERPVEEPDHRPTPAASGRRPGVALALPVINPRIATAVTGALVGLIGVVLVYLTGRGCEEVRGVGSCGGIGLFALLLILAIEVVLGAAVLKAWRVYDPVSTSFLGVGLVAVFVLLFLLSSLESVWMLLVIPLISALTFVVSWWVTETFVEDSSGTR